MSSNNLSKNQNSHIEKTEKIGEEKLSKCQIRKYCSDQSYPCSIFILKKELGLEELKKMRKKLKKLQLN